MVFSEVVLCLFWSIDLVMNKSYLVILGLKYLMIAVASRASPVDPAWGFVPGSYLGSHSASCFGTCFVHCLSANALRFFPIPLKHHFKLSG